MKKFLTLLGIGILIGFLAAYLYYEGFFISWIRLADMPEKPQEIVAVNKGIWIKAESASIYHHVSHESFPFVPVDCSQNCWQKFETAPTNDTQLFLSDGCGRHIPSTRWLADSVTACQGFGVGALAFAYGFDNTGKIYYWSHEIGDMDGLVYYGFPVLGGVIGMAIFAIWLFISGVYARIQGDKAPVNFDDLPDN